MANPRGNPQNLKPCRPGEPSRNPSGKPKGLLTKDRVKSILSRFSNMTRADLQKVVDDPKSNMIDVIVATIMQRAAKDGDFSRLDFVLNRAIGKPTIEELSELAADGSGTLVVTPQNIADLCKAARDAG